jgi:predicted amidohydrolase
VLINIANWPTARIFAWETLLRARAIENQSYVIGVNRVGDDPSSSYNGRSVIIDPMGSTVLAAGEDECIVYANVEKAEVEKIRTRYPFLADMRSWQGGNA